MMNNPLADAVEACDYLRDVHSAMMFAVSGDAAFNPYDEVLSDAVFKLISASSKAMQDLSPRAQQARLNLIWKTFIAEQRCQRNPPLPVKES